MNINVSEGSKEEGNDRKESRGEREMSVVQKKEEKESMGGMYV